MNKKENNNHKFNIKDLKFINKRLIITVLLLIITIASGTLAWFTYRSDKSALVLKVGNIDDVRVILKPYHITGSLTPSDDYDKGLFTSVEAINDSDFAAELTLYYKINQLSDALLNSGLRSVIVETHVYDDGGYDIWEYNWRDFSELVDSNVDTITLEAHTTRYFDIYIWLDNSVDNTAAQGEVLDVELTGTVEFESRDFGDNIYICNDSDKSISIYNDVTCYGTICDYTRVDDSSVQETMQISSYDVLNSNLTIDGIKSSCGSDYVTTMVDDDNIGWGFSSVDYMDDVSRLPEEFADFINVYEIVKINNIDLRGDTDWNLTWVSGMMYYGLSGITSVNITGDNIVGSVLTANGTDMNSENTYSYQWYTNGTNSTTGGVAISGATSETLTLTEDYIGKYVYVVLTSVTPELGTITFTDITDEKIITNITTINEKRYTCDDETVTVTGEIRNGVAQNLSLKTITIYDITTCNRETCNYTKKNGVASDGTITVDSLDDLKAGLTYDKVRQNCGENYAINYLASSDWNVTGSVVDDPVLGDFILSTGEYLPLSPITGYSGWYALLDGPVYVSYLPADDLITEYKNIDMYTCDSNNSITIYHVLTCDTFACTYNEQNGISYSGDNFLLKDRLQSGLDPDSVRTNCGDSYVTEYTIIDDIHYLSQFENVIDDYGVAIFEYGIGDKVYITKINGYEVYWLDELPGYVSIVS